MMTNGTYLAWRDSMTTLDGLGAWSTEKRDADRRRRPERIRIGQITPSLMPCSAPSPLQDARSRTAKNYRAGHRLR